MDPAILLTMFILSFIFVIVCGLFSGREYFRFVLLFVYICITIGNPFISDGVVGIPLFGLTPPHICVCPKQGPGFPTVCVVVVSSYMTC
jgi:hypothetical protein